MTTRDEFDRDESAQWLGAKLFAATLMADPNVDPVEVIQVQLYTVLALVQTERAMQALRGAPVRPLVVALRGLAEDLETLEQ